MIKEELQGSEPGEETILEAENLLRNQFSRRMMSLFNPQQEESGKDKKHELELDYCLFAHTRI